MSEEQLKAFLEKVNADTSLQEKLKAAVSPDAAIEIAKEAGFLITAEDIQSMPSKPVEVSDEELEGAAGGWGQGDCMYSQESSRPGDPRCQTKNVSRGNPACASLGL